MRLVEFLLVSGVVLGGGVGCQQEDTQAPPATSDVGVRTSMSDLPAGSESCVDRVADIGEAAPAYVGLLESDAEALARRDGLSFVVISRDGSCRSPQGLNIDPNRLNVIVEGGTVVAAYRV